MLDLAPPRRILAAVIAGLVVGCAAPTPDDPWSFLPAGAVTEMNVREAYRTDRGVVLEYGVILYGEPPEQSLFALTPITIPTDGAVAAPIRGVQLEPLPDEEWNELLPTAEPLPVLSRLDWRAYQQRFLESVAPAEPNAGVVIRTTERDEVLVFRHPSGAPAATDLAAKPDEVSIDRSVGMQEVAAHHQRLLTEFLEDRGIADRRGVFSTGAVDDSYFPSLYFDLDAGEFELHRNDRFVDVGGFSRQAARGAKKARRLGVQGHVVDVVSRPVSNLYRVGVALTKQVYDTVKPVNLRRIGLSGEIPPVVAAGAPEMDLEEFEATLDRITKTRRSPGSVELLIGGDEFFPRLFDTLYAAESSIDLRMFIFSIDDYAVSIADVLRRRSEDVRVRVLLDGVGTVMGADAKRDVMIPGFVPPLSIADYLEGGSDVSLRVRTPPLLYADHTKAWLIDRRICFTGGMNIGREYRYDWHDLMVELQGPVVDEIDYSFRETWVHAGWSGDFGYALTKPFRRRQKTAPRPGDHPIRVLRTRSDLAEIYRAQVAAIKASRRSILIENAYFADDEILTELIAARRRGVDVRVILPVAGNHAIMNANNLVMTNIMLEHGIRVFLYPGMSHVKAAIYDGWACLGTANFDRLSLRRNLELNVAYTDPAAVEELRRCLFDVDFAASTEVTEPFQVGWSERLRKILAKQL